MKPNNIVLLSDLHKFADEFDAHDIVDAVINKFSVIVAVERTDGKWSYLNSLGCWSPIDCLSDFGDPHEQETPKRYKTLRGAEKILKKADPYSGQCLADIGGRLALWNHPDDYHNPIHKYLKITGICFPGSPSQ